MVLSKIGTTVVAGGGWGKRLACNGFTEIPSELRGNPPPRLPRWILPMQQSTIYPVAPEKNTRRELSANPSRILPGRRHGCNFGCALPIGPQKLLRGLQTIVTLARKFPVALRHFCRGERERDLGKRRLLTVKKPNMDPCVVGRASPSFRCPLFFFVKCGGTVAVPFWTCLRQSGIDRWFGAAVRGVLTARGWEIVGLHHFTGAERCGRIELYYMC